MRPAPLCALLALFCCGTIAKASLRGSALMLGSDAAESAATVAKTVKPDNPAKEQCKALNKECTSCKWLDSSKTKVTCTACTASKWQLTSPKVLPRKCECAPRYGYKAGSKSCNQCASPYYCPGGTSPPRDCPTGLATIAAKKSSKADCLTKAGFGRKTTLDTAGSVTNVIGYPCDKGTYGPAKSSGECEDCPVGLTTENVKATKATQCVAGPGFYYDDVNNIGIPCDKGTYSDSYNKETSCIPCSDGTTTPGNASDTIGACSLALPGYYLVNINEAAQCEVNTYNEDERDITQCDPCPQDLITMDVGAASSSLCVAPDGWYIGPDGKGRECPRGSYTDAPNSQDSCTPCPTGATTEDVGSMSQGDCNIAMKGYHMVTGQAEPCPTNTYSDKETQFGSCTACPKGLNTQTTGADSVSLCLAPPGSYLTADGTGQLCPNGTYTDTYNTLSSCINCATGVTTSGNGANNAAACSIAKKGYVMTGATTAQPCPPNTYNELEAAGSVCYPCLGGLSTVGAGTDSASGCLAPAGSYVDIDTGTAKLCPKGSYTVAANALTGCTKCPTGITTADQGSSSADACGIAAKGYRLTGTSTAEPCPASTYNDVESPGSVCKACPEGLRTQNDTAIDISNCQVPPGFEVKPGAVVPTQCEKDKFKDTWGDTPCVLCGTNLFTTGTGSSGKADCLVPAGMGLTSFTVSPWKASAALCLSNTYSAKITRSVMADNRPVCFKCPAGRYTLDYWLNATDPAPTSGFTSPDDCLVPPGYGAIINLQGQIESVQICDVGWYNPGKNLSPCKRCINDWPTEREGSTSVTDCKFICFECGSSN